ncbi:MAG TPA: rhomboid family intramembrane serine protease [Alphaproteobacteria bacterium]|nr:rhomboid family intramembrane serine protease [Alphaproteobacteria bacterium]
MPSCPSCRIGLETARQRGGVYYYCSQCNGRAVSMPQIRRMAGELFASGLLLKMSTTTQASWLTCPFCETQMKSFNVSNPPITLDSCKSCGMVWFEAGKFEITPEGVIESGDALLLTPAEADVKRKSGQEAVLGEDYLVGPPKQIWKWFPAVAGFPVKFYGADSARLPWTMWLLSALIAIVSFCTFPHLKPAVENFGLIPAQALRYGGATFFTSFFLHGGIEHLLGNLYFFLLFGAEVEDFLGWWRFLVLIFLSAFVGDVIHILGNLHSEIPTIGASGGISGVMAFYACKFPRARIGFFFVPLFLILLFFGRTHWWLRLPAWTAFGLWFLLQLHLAGEQMIGLTNVAALAHIGGVATGFVLWRLWSKRPSPAWTPESAS